ncbi:MAG: ABC transporter permease subunit, partial [Ignavibacteriaceae bacterium]|nr:ABC transporter permease subunit [Ignavibacteriaceae bacterium]
MNKYLWIYPTAYFVLWVLLFEFILPANNILPKPSTVIESVGTLWSEYNLLYNLLSTIGAIYISIFLAYFVVRFFVHVIGRDNHLFHFIFSLEGISRYIPGLVLGIFLIYWFPNSELVEFIFAFLTAFLSFTIKINDELRNIPDEYVNSIRSLGAEEFFIRKNIIWKILQPGIIKHAFLIHKFLWITLIAFEFIKGGFGIGVIFKKALQYNDLAVIFLTALI